MSTNPNEIPPPAAPHPVNITEIMAQQLQIQQQLANLMTQFANPQQQNGPQQRSSKPTRPTIEADSSDNGWIIFEDSWSRYKEMAQLTNQAAIRNELRSTCSPKVNEMLFNFVGPEVLNTASEADLLKFIKSVAVKTVHPEVYRQQFFNLRQSDCESVTSFISRLKAQAMLCDFKTSGTCESDDCSPSFASDMIRSQLIAGIRNSAHQAKVLAEIATLQTLEDLTTRLIALETTVSAATQFRSPFENTASDVAAVKPFDAAPVKPFKPKRPNDQKKQCSGCGKSIHPNGRSSCPAWQKICHKCKKPNHFASVCRSTQSTSVASIGEDPEPTVSHLSSINAIPI